MHLKFQVLHNLCAANLNGDSPMDIDGSYIPVFMMADINPEYDKLEIVVVFCVQVTVCRAFQRYKHGIVVTLVQRHFELYSKDIHASVTLVMNYFWSF